MAHFGTIRYICAIMLCSLMFMFIKLLLPTNANYERDHRNSHKIDFEKKVFLKIYCRQKNSIRGIQYYNMLY